MQGTHKPQAGPPAPAGPAAPAGPVYQLRLRGQLGPAWADWFAGLAVTLDDHGDTLLTGPVVDQAALHGVLKRVRDVGLPLLAVNCLDEPCAPEPCAPEPCAPEAALPSEHAMHERLAHAPGAVATNFPCEE